jgi:signal transduction histidine kinase
MKSAAREKADSFPNTALAEQYRSALERHIHQGDEASLGRGYEIGRQALAEGQSLMDIAAVHHHALRELLFRSPSVAARESLLQSAAHFFTETVSPYEMAHRGFQDAVRALRQMNDRLEEQIKGIAYAVHDEAGQLLVAVHLALAGLATELPEAQRAQIVQIEGLLNSVEKQLRQYSHELRPTILDDLGWIPAIRFLADGVSKRANLQIHFDAEIAARLPANVETAIYRVVQEALNNTVKHSGATAVWISVKKDGTTLFCSVRDNGGGFDVPGLLSASHRRGLGLSGMQERLKAVGGTLRLESTRGKGTLLQINLPLENSDANSSRTRG